MANPWDNDPILQPTGPQTVTIGTRDPAKAIAEERAAEAAARADRREDRMADSADVSNDLKRAELEIKRQQLEREGNTAKQLTEWRGNLNNIKLLQGQIASLRKQYEDNFAGKGLQSLAESYAPTGIAPKYGVFEQTAQSLIADLAKAKGLTSQQFNTPAEQRMFFEPLLPKRSDPDEVIVSKLDYLEKMIESGRQTTLQNLGQDTNGQQADDELGKAAGFVDPSPPGLPPVGQSGNAPTPWDGPNADMQSVATGDYRFQDNPRARSTIASLINAGAGYATVAAAAKKAGGNLSLGEFNSVKTWMAQNPGKEYPASSVRAGEYVPLNLGQKIAGSPTGAFTAQMANAATAGTVGAISGERGKGALDAMSALHPNASLAGNIVGGVTGAMGAELGVGSRLAGTAAERFAPRIADSLYGATSGFNGAADGEGLQGALTGAVVAPVGGAVGERAMSAVGSGLRGVVNPAVLRLRDAGIPLTIGQAVGQSGRLGNFINRTEQAMSSIPGVGSMVAGRFDDGTRGLNRAAFEIGAETTGDQVNDIGSAGLGQLRQAVGDTYSRALDPVTIDANDPALIGDIVSTIHDIQRIPNVNGAQEAAMSALRSRLEGATDPVTEQINGRGFQEAYRGLARTGRERANGDYGHEVGQVMRQGQDALAGALERQNPGAYDGFVNANTANRRAMVLADAVNAARNQTDEMFTPAQLNAADANSATRLTGRLNSASGNRPFHQLAQDAQQVMGNRVPNSGTADRAMTGLMLGGLTGAGAGAGAGYLGGDTASGAGGGALLAALLMAGGTRGGQRAAVSLLADRPDLLRAIGTGIQDRAQLGRRIGAGIGSSILTPMLVDQY